jgi:hypothetical protein
MSGREYAQLKSMLGCQNVQERVLLAGQTCIYRDTPSNRVVGQKSGAPDVPTHRHRTYSAASGALDLATCLARSKFNGRLSEHRTRPTPSTQRPTPSVQCTPVSIQRQFSLTGCVRRWVNRRPASGAREGSKELLTSHNHRTLHSVWPTSDAKASDTPMTTSSARACRHYVGRPASDAAATSV